MAFPAGITFTRMGSERDPPDAVQLAVLERTVALLPRTHLALLRNIEARRPTQPPFDGGGHALATGTVRLSAASFRASHNIELNTTFLHEVGHIVDEAFGITPELRRRARRGDADAAALLATGHEGATGGDGERTADCYMVMMRATVLHSAYRHPADPGAYAGSEATRRFAALTATTAWQRSLAVAPAMAGAAP